MASVLLAAACSKKEEAAAPAPVPATAPATSAAPPAPAPIAAPAAPAAPAATRTAAADPSKRLQVYIQCYNRLDSRAHRTIARYVSWVKNMETGPTGQERIVYGLYPIDTQSIEDCQQSITAAAARQPAFAALDPAATNWVQVIQALDGTVNEAYADYDRENYKDDQFAKGKALHPTLVSQAKAFKEASERFAKELDAENDKLLAAELAEVERTEGRKLTYWRMSLMAQAKQLAAVLGEDDFSVEEATRRLANFESTTDETMKYGAANKAELLMSWTTIEHAAEEYRKAAKQRLRRVRDKVPYSQGEKSMLRPGSAWMVDGSQEQFTKAYNGLVEASNQLR
jgi:hypothetical protein